MTINIDLEHHALHTVVYRVGNYLTNPDRQEKIIFSGGNADMAFWKELAKYEKSHQKSQAKNNEAREIEIPLPNDLIQDQARCKKVVEDIIRETIGTDTPHTYVLHQKAKGKIQDNLHVHIVYSERQRNKELKPKTYKRDIWYDFQAKKMSKKGVGEIIHHKGDIMKDNEGNTLYDSDPFTIKNDYYATKQCTYNFKQKTTNILNSYGYDFKIYSKDSPYLKQKKLYKGYSEEKRNEIIDFNNNVKDYNKKTEELLNIKPELKNEMVKRKKELFKNKNIPLLDKIKNLKQLVINTINQTKEKLKEATREIAFKWKVAKKSVKDFGDKIVVKDFQDGFTYDITLLKKDFKVLEHDNPEQYKLGIKKNPYIEIRDARPELSFNVKKGDENLLLKHLGVNLDSIKKQQQKTPLNLNEYKEKAKQYNSDRAYTPTKSKGWERE